jgi:hypothetical protein
MGAKTNTQQLSTQTPMQQALMKAMIQKAMEQMAGTNLGGTWGGVGSGAPAPALSPGGAGAKPANAGAPGGQGLQGILAQGSLGVRDQFTKPFTSPFRKNLY